MALKKMEPAPTSQYRGGREPKTRKGAHIKFVQQRQNMKGNDSTVQGKTKHTPT